MILYANGNGHMTKMTGMPIYGKHLNNLLLQNQKTNDLGTWYVVFGVPCGAYLGPTKDPTQPHTKLEQQQKMIK